MANGPLRQVGGTSKCHPCTVECQVLVYSRDEPARAFDSEIAAQGEARTRHSKAGLPGTLPGQGTASLRTLQQLHHEAHRKLKLPASQLVGHIGGFRGKENEIDRGIV